MNFPRFVATATLLANGQVLIAGGETQSGAYVLPAELYNPATAKFTVTGSLHYPRVSAGQALFAAVRLNDGTVLIVGGATFTQGAGWQYPPPELYNPAAGTFSVLPPPPVPLANAAATLLANGKVLVTGGLPENPPTPMFQQAFIFDPATQAFSNAGSPGAAFQYSQLLLPDGDVLLVGGEGDDQSSGPDSPAQIYHVATNSWETISDSPRAWSPGAVVLPNGKVLVNGGGDVNYIEGWRMYLFDPTQKTFSYIGKSLLPTGGSDFLLPDGHVLLEGFGLGWELYNPGSASLTEAGLCGLSPAPVNSSAATQLGDGTVLVSSQIYSSTPELFHENVTEFTISLPPSPVTNSSADSGTLALTTTPLNGFSGPLNLSCETFVPNTAGTTCSAPASVNAGATAAIAYNYSAGENLFFVTAASTDFNYWAAAFVQTPDIGISAATPSVTVPASYPAQYGITVATDSCVMVQLTCSGLPKNASCGGGAADTPVDSCPTALTHTGLTIFTAATTATATRLGQSPPATLRSSGPWPFALRRRGVTPLVAIFVLMTGFLLSLPAVGFEAPGRRARISARLALGFLTILLATCGGTSASSASKQAPSPCASGGCVAPGTYTITIGAKDAGGQPGLTTSSTTVTLIVK
jgi:hypothetical protein